MATVSKWTPFEVALDLTATGSTVTRKSATQFTVKINASWETYYSGALTNYGMTASSGGGSVTLNPFGTKASSGSGSFTGTYSISGNGAATKSITVTFRNFNNDNGKSATKTVSFNVNVPAWTSYAITYNANGGSGAPGSQTKWKDQTLTLSSTKPTRTGYSFLGWSTSSSATSASYTAGGSYTTNSAATLYAVWKANTYKVTYNANGGTGAPSAQTKTYGVTLTLSSVKPTRTNYTFKGWATSASATKASYQAGGSYTSNAAITLYAVWELSYKKPEITNVSVTRSETGDSIVVKFTWKTYVNVSTIRVIAESSAGVKTFDVIGYETGPSNAQRTLTGLDPELAYTIRIDVTDGYPTTFSVSKTVPGLVFAMDVKAGAKGVAFGKAAELEGYADFGFPMKSSYGEIISTPMEVPEGSHLDDLVNPGHYIIGNTTSSTTIQGKPLWYASSNGTATIEVTRSGDGQQIIQRFYPCQKNEQFEISRMRYSGTWSNWMITGGCTDWRTLTIDSGFEAYTTGVTDPKYRVNGNVVTVTGAVKPKATVASGTTGVIFATGIAAQFRPSSTLAFVCQGSGINRWLLQVNSSGELYLSRYGTTEYVDIPTGAWLIFTVSYSI